jgi:DNA helicase HerA-like ATPase
VTGESEVDVATTSLEKAAEAVKLAVEEYLAASKSEKELEDSIKYSSLDVLKSVTEKLENLKATGLFKNKKPAFSSNIQRHNIKALSDDEQRMYVLLSLERLLEEAKRKGVSPNNRIRDVYFVDEAAKFFSDDTDNILNVISREARKFGVALICASQSPEHFSDDFISSVGAKIILGIDEMFWLPSTRKLQLTMSDMESVQPRRKLLMQVKTTGEARGEWQLVNLG